MSTPLRTLVSATELLHWRGPAKPLLLDCGFDLTKPEVGEAAFAQAHLPGALYLHLERDLSGPKADAAGRFLGRHPLPSRDAFAALAGRLGITPGVPVVAYDAQGGPYAARAWWLLRWLGHADVAVLDGGPAAWLAEGGTLTRESAQPTPCPPYPDAAPLAGTVGADSLFKSLGRVRLIDARAGERFRGEVEPLDSKAGHVPGALNRFFKDNLAADGRFKSAEALRADWAPLLAGHAPESVVHQCGSGVTACHNLLAAEHAGLGAALLYPGSWSEWSCDAARPVAIG